MSPSRRGPVETRTLPGDKLQRTTRISPHEVGRGRLSRLKAFWTSANNTCVKHSRFGTGEPQVPCEK